MKPFGCIIAVLIATGAIFLGIGCLILYQDIAFLANGRKTFGTVIDNNATEDGPRSFTTVYLPTVKYKPAEKKTISVEIRSGSGSTRKYQIGSTVRVMYLPSDPTQVMLANDVNPSSWKYWAPAAMFVILGGVVLLVTAMVYAGMRQKRSSGS